MWGQLALIGWLVASADGSTSTSVGYATLVVRFLLAFCGLEFYDSQIGLSITCIRKLGVIPQNNPSNPMKSIYLNGAETL